MADKLNNYDFIAGKIDELKRQYPALRARTDDYVFSALCIKANFYKNPALTLRENDFAEMIVDSPNDGGVDILLSDPNSETADLVIGQSKFYQKITNDDVLNAVRKMADFYKDMQAGHYERVNEQTQSRFLTLNAEIGDESKIHFVFYTSAPKNRIDAERIKRKFCEQFIDTCRIEIAILFANDIVEEIREAESIKPTVELGKIRIDKANNYLMYGDAAAIVNVSAFSIKELYARHNINLLSLNLRYHINGGKIDKEIRETIDKTPESFWLKNNGITIICDDFRIDGCEVKLWNFSIVNGGQTTYLIHRSESIDKKNFFWIPCKIIKNTGKTPEEKNLFSLEIAQATNSQKPIQDADLKTNTHEQRRFSQVLRTVDIFYKNKRGETVPTKYNDTYSNTNLAEVGKLCMAAIFQEPCKSKNKPSDSYKEAKYYNPIFKDNPEQVAKICKELLYIDYYFDKIFQPDFEAKNKNKTNAEKIIPFANNARRICIAFVTLAARYHQGNITDENLTKALNSARDDLSKVEFYKIFRDLGDMKFLLPQKLYTDAYDAALDKLFKAIIKAGTKNYSFEYNHNHSLTVRNFLQSDKNYYEILREHWDTFQEEIRETFANV